MVLEEEKYFLAALRLLWIEADRQAEKPDEERSADKAQKVLDAVEEQIAPGTEAIDWSEFIDLDFMAWWTRRTVHTLKDLDVSGLLLRTSRPTDIVEVLDAQMKNRDVEVTLLLREIAKSVSGSKPLQSVASALATDKQYEKALDVAQSIHFDENCAKALNSITSSLADARDGNRATAVLAKAFEIAQDIDWEAARTEALLGIAEALFNTDNEKKADTVFEEALDVARSIAGAFDRTIALTGVATHLLRAERQEQAIDALEQALNRVQTNDSKDVRAEALLGIERSIEFTDDRAAALLDIAKTLSTMGEDQRAVTILEEALDTARSIDNYNDRVEALLGIAEALASVGEIQQAVGIASSLNSDDDRGKALYNVAETLANAGEYAQAESILLKALDTVRTIDSYHHRTAALYSIAEMLSELGSDKKATAVLELAIEAGHSINSSPDRVEALHGIAETLFKLGREERAIPVLEEALDNARSINSERRRTKAFTSLAQTLIENGEEEQATATIDGIFSFTSPVDSGHYRAETLQYIAQAFANTGQPEQALDISHCIDSSPELAKSLYSIAESFAEKEMDERAAAILEETLDTARSVGKHLYRAEILTQVAQFLADKGEDERASSLQKEAIEMVGWSPHADISPLCRMAKRLFSMREDKKAVAILEDALEIASFTETAARSDHVALYRVTSVLAEIGDENAIDTISNSDGASPRIALCGLAKAFADEGKNEQAVTTLKEVPLPANEARKANTLCGVAEGFSEIGEDDRAYTFLEDALDTARSIEKKYWNEAGVRAESLFWNAQVLENMGRDEQATSVYGEALAATNSISDRSQRSSSMAQIAKQQARDSCSRTFASHLSNIELDHDGWLNFLPNWRDALQEHVDEPRPLLRRSFTLYPFDAEAAYEGVYSLMQAHVQVGAMDYAEAIARECPELELDVLIRTGDSDRDPDDLPEALREQYDQLENLRDQGLLDEEEFDEKAEALFEQADLE